jgi:hypothetical protein
MFGLTPSKVKGNEYLMFDIPNEENFKIGIHEDGDYITIGAKDNDNNVWYRLGDRMDLRPEKLKNAGLTCYRGSNKKEQRAFIVKMLKLFK